MPKNNKSIFAKTFEKSFTESFGGGGSTFGGAPGGGSGNFSVSAGQKATRWAQKSPPHRGQTGNAVTQNVKDIGAESEDFAKLAGQNKPYPLNNIVDNLVDAYTALSLVEKSLRNSVKYSVSLFKADFKSEPMEDLIRRVHRMTEEIKAISKDVDDITVS